MADALEAPGSPEGRFTYAEYKDWNPEQTGRYEIIDGEAYAMAAPNAHHQTVQAALTAHFYNFLAGKPCKVYPAPFDVRLFYAEDESDDTAVQPDITVICDEKKRGKEGCRGAPDFVAEILSPANTALEMARKFRLYREAGVREYWVLDPESKTLLAHRFEQGQILTRFYQEKDTAPVDILPGLAIALEPVFAE
ncbi:MAG: Uma2 family endonuclease [Treponema sp.]|jgi:Uma2 family endonuclease|nr:Uma2 family endonuclease [Treponema sp.]